MKQYQPVGSNQLPGDTMYASYLRIVCHSGSMRCSLYQDHILCRHPLAMAVAQQEDSPGSHTHASAPAFLARQQQTSSGRPAWIPTALGCDSQQQYNRLQLPTASSTPEQEPAKRDLMMSIRCANMI